MSQTRVLFLIDELDIGGTEQQIFELATRINPERFEPLVCCFRKGQIAREIEAAGVPLFSLRKRGKTDLPFLFRLARLMKKQRVELLQTYLFTANVWGHLAGRLAGIPLIVSSERNVDIWEKPYKKLAGRFLVASCAAVIANAEAVKRYLVQKGVPGEKISTICNGVNPERFNGFYSLVETRSQWGIDQASPVIGSIARLEPQKGHASLLQAAKMVLRKAPDARFLIVGDGPERSRLERLSQELGIAGSVIFTGPTRDVPRLLGACDLSVLASSKEGMSNSLLESMALGKPVVATRVGGNDEVVLDGETGFLVPCDDPHALGAACLKLVEDKELAKKMGAKGKERVVEKFSVSRMVQSTERLYEKLIVSRP